MVYPCSGTGERLSRGRGGTNQSLGQQSETAARAEGPSQSQLGHTDENGPDGTAWNWSGEPLAATLRARIDVSRKRWESDNQSRIFTAKGTATRITAVTERQLPGTRVNSCRPPAAVRRLLRCIC